MKHHITLILLVFWIASCTAEPATSPVIPSTSMVTSSLIPATATFTPSPLPPTETQTPFVPKATIKIAGHGPFSGDLAVVLGIDIMRGANLAVKQLSVPLMNLGYKTELVPFDDQNDAGISVAVAKEIVADPEILCIVGPATSRILNQVKEIYHQAGLAFVSPSATAAFATASGYLEVNRVLGRHDGQGVAGALLAKQLGISRVFTVSQNSDYAQFNTYHFRNEAGRMGIEVVGNLTTDDTKGFGVFIDHVMAANAELVYFSSLNVEQAGTFFREARTAGYMGAFLGNEGINSPALLEFAGPLVVEGGGMYYTAIAAPASYYPEAAEFLEQFETLHGTVPQIFAAHAYDAAGICMKAIEEASRFKGGEIPARVEVANTIRALQGYKGITETYNFNKNGDPDPAQYFVYQVVSPDPNDWDQNPLITSFELSPPK